MTIPQQGDFDRLGTHVCSACGEPHASRDELAAHRRDGHFAAADRGPTGTTASGHSGTTPPTGTGGVATP